MISLHIKKALVLVASTTALLPIFGTANAAFDSSICSSQTTIPTFECTALEDIYNSTNGDDWLVSSIYKWNSSNPMSRWAGLGISDSGRVTSLVLLEKDMNGSIPSTIKNLSELTTLDLRKNMLIGDIPSEISNLANLTSLNLSDNNFSGTLPNSLAELTNLTSLYIAGNSLDRDKEYKALIPDALTSWVGSIDELSVSIGDQRDIVPPVASNLGIIISPLKGVFEFTFDITENSFAKDVIGNGMRITFDENTNECKDLETASFIMEKSGEVTIAIDSTALPEGTQADCIMTVHDHGNLPADGDTLSNSVQIILPTFEVDVTPPLKLDVSSPESPFSTADGDIPFVGTTEPRADVLVTGPNDETCNVQADEDGNWTCDIAPTLPDNNNTVTVTATDFAGNSSEPVLLEILVDSTAPEAPELVNPADGSTTSKTPNITGSAEAQTTLTIEIDGTIIDTLLVPEDTQWQYEIPEDKALSDGNHTATVYTTDEMGNVSENTTHQFSVDTTAPDSLVSPDLIDESDTGMLESDNITYDKTPTFTGPCIDGDIVQLFEGENEIMPTGTCTNGNYEITPDADFTDGEYNITAKSTDPNGNTSATSETLLLTIDTVTPDLTEVLNPSDGTSMNDRDPLFTGNAEPLSYVNVVVENRNVCTVQVPANGSWECEITEQLDEGSYSFNISTEDVAGNESAPSKRNITIDTSTPSAPTVSSPVSGAFVTDTQPTIKGTAPAGSTVYVVGPNGEQCTVTADAITGLWECVMSPALQEGPNTLTIKAVTPEGKMSPSLDHPFIIGTNPNTTNPGDLQTAKETTVGECPAIEFFRYPENRGNGVNAFYFSDAPFAHRAYKGLIDLAEQGIITGDNDTRNARLDDTINRSEFVKIMTIAREDTYKEGICNGDSSFPDVDDEAWFHDFVRNMEQHNIVQGYPDGYYRPGRDINLAEVYKVMAISFGYITKEQADTISLFESSDWYVPYKKVLINDGVVPNWMSGYDAATFVTRGDTFAMLSNILKKKDGISIN